MDANQPDFKNLDDLGKVDKLSGQIRKKDDESANCILISEFVGFLLEESQSVHEKLVELQKQMTDKKDVLGQFWFLLAEDTI